MSAMPDNGGALSRATWSAMAEHLAEQDGYNGNASKIDGGL